jgi:hypothetical protein
MNVTLVEIEDLVAFYDAYETPVDPAGGHRYWVPLKPCESRGERPRRIAQ